MSIPHIAELDTDTTRVRRRICQCNTCHVTKLQRLAQHKAGEPDPFVVGRDGYQRFLDVMSECSRVQLARRTGP